MTQPSLNHVFLYEYQKSEESYKLTPIDFRDIELVNQKAKNRIISYVNSLNHEAFQFQASHFVGIIHLRHYRIQVLPKIYKENQEDSISLENAMDNLLSMLKNALDLNIKIDKISQLSSSKDFLEILIQYFLKLLDSKLKSGLIHEYILEESNLNYIKGKLLFKENIKHNLHNKAHFYCEYDFFSPDNIINQIIKRTLQVLRNICVTSQNRLFIAKLLPYFDSISDKKILSSDFKKIHFSRLNKHYQEIINLGQLFLSNYYPGLNVTNKIQSCYAFVFDMNELFERFVAGILSSKDLTRLFQENNWDLSYRISQNYRTLATRNGVNLFELKPDFMFISHKNSTTNSNRIPLILDTKYKLLEPENRNLGISSADMYQMFAYGMKYECKHIILLYPYRSEYSNCDWLNYNLELEQIPKYEIKIPNQGPENKKNVISITIFTINLNFENEPFIRDVKNQLKTILTFYTKLNSKLIESSHLI